MTIVMLILAILFVVAAGVYPKTKFANRGGVVFNYVIPVVLFAGSIYTVAGFSVRGAVLRQPALLEDMDRVYQENKQEIQAAAQKKALKKLSKSDYEGSPYLGADDADVVVLEFFDYTCPYCVKSLPATEDFLAKDKKAKLVLMNFVVHPQIGTIPAKAAIAAAKQGDKEKLAKFHHEIFNAQLVPAGATEENIAKKQNELMLSLAKKVGLDVERLKTDMNDPSVENEIVKVRNVAAKLNINGTPGFVIGNTQIIPGFVQSGSQLVDAANKAR